MTSEMVFACKTASYYLIKSQFISLQCLSPWANCLWPIASAWGRRRLRRLRSLSTQWTLRQSRVARNRTGYRLYI